MTLGLWVDGMVNLRLILERERGGNDGIGDGETWGLYIVPSTYSYQSILFYPIERSLIPSSAVLPVVTGAIGYCIQNSRVFLTTLEIPFFWVLRLALSL
jgi:hypothetical protein